MSRSSAVFAAVRMVTVICFGTVPFPLFSMSGNSLSSCPSWLGTEAGVPGAYSGMAGCLILV